MSSTSIPSSLTSSTSPSLLPSTTLTFNAGSYDAWMTTVPVMDPTSTFEPVPWKYSGVYIGGQLYNLFALTTTPSLNLPAACTLQTCALKLGYVQYLPNLAANAFLMAFSSMLLLLNIYLTIRRKQWSPLLLILATFLQIIGFSTRLALRNNPFSQPLFLLQFTSLSIGPVLILISIRQTFNYLLTQHCTNLPRLPPTASLIAFLIADYISLLLQCAGAVINVSAIEGSALQAQGAAILLAGLSIQLLGLSLFVAFCADLAVRYLISSKYQRSGIYRIFTSPREILGEGKRTLGVPALLALATLALALRCIYRVVGFQAGLSTPWAQLEVPFMVFEGGCVAIAALAQTLVCSGLVPLGVPMSEDVGTVSSEESAGFESLVRMWKGEKGGGFVRVVEDGGAFGGEESMGQERAEMR